MNSSPSASADSRPAEPYMRRAPSPPFIHIDRHDPMDPEPLRIHPCFENGDPGLLTDAERFIITRNAPLEAYDGSGGWSYNKRHEAQQILDWLYVGPRSVIKEKADWLRSEGITLILIIHETVLAPAMEGFAKNAAARTGIQTSCFAVDSSSQLIGHFPAFVAAINGHVLQQSLALAPQNAGGTPPRAGKVLVTCQTGNFLANAVAAAYIIAMYGCGISPAVNYVSWKRFCSDFNEDTKRVLVSWVGLVNARAAVNKANGGSQAFVGVSSLAATAESRKRTIHDTEEDEDPEAPSTEFSRQMLDHNRFSGRAALQPFIEADQGAAGPSRANDTMELN